MFGMEEMPSPNDYRTPPFMKDHSVLLVNARSGISLLLEMLSPRSIWVPSYLCGAILEAVGGGTTNVRFYEVDYDLVLPSLRWLDNIEPNDIVILIDYFGFPCNRSYITRVKEQGAWILEDACQALLSGGVGRFADFVLFSPRKFVGVPDGGILLSNGKGDLCSIDLKRPPSRWWNKALRAAVMRRRFDTHGGSRRWLELFQEVELECPTGPYAMSDVSKKILMNGFDRPAIARRRVANYQILAEELGRVTLFPDLSSDVVPLGFPIRVKNRDRVRQTLFVHEIYPPIHWPIQGIVPERFRDSHRLATEIMTLPCDQRYDSDDMERMASLILKEDK
jgi:dTDP-4-amino-4,6-dideoxygalactose transaminase